MIRRTLFEICSALYPRLGAGIPRRGYLSRERYHALEQALLYTHDEKVPGDYVEFGVANGRTLIYAYELCQKYGLLGEGRFLGFDSFEGIPAPGGPDANAGRFVKGETAYARRIVERNLWLFGADRTKFELVEGWFDKTLVESTRERLKLTAARVVNVDCDLHDSALASLRFITKSLSSGSVLLFDDWLCFRASPVKGEQGAVAQWLQENPSLRLVPYRSYANVGQSFIVRIE